MCRQIEVATLARALKADFRNGAEYLALLQSATDQLEGNGDPMGQYGDVVEELREACQEVIRAWAEKLNSVDLATLADDYCTSADLATLVLASWLS